MEENNIEELKQTLEELYRTQQARLDVGADDLDIREEIAEVEEEIKELQDETMEENSIKNERSSIEEDIILLKDFTEGNFKRDKLENYKGSYKMGCFYYKDIQRAIEHIILDYKRVLKENEMYKKNSEIISKEILSTAEQLKVEIKENFRLKNQLENNRKEYQETYKDVREELKELKKENEELLQEKIDNQKINLLAQNSMLDYQKGYEDGKANRGSAVQTIIDNQQYYIFRKQIEKYEEHIEKLQKENEELKEIYRSEKKMNI